MKSHEWAQGYHTSSNGKQTLLKDLPTAYLKNIINKYQGEHDTSALEAEIKSRPEQ